LGKRAWPPWWAWDIDLTFHVLERMADRSFTEADLRDMLENATGFRRDVVEGRWIIEAGCGRQAWEVIVEPDIYTGKLAIITAYSVTE
jgi:hypothetical protein